MRADTVATLVLLAAAVTPAIAGGNCPKIARSLERRGYVKRDNVNP